MSHSKLGSGFEIYHKLVIHLEGKEIADYKTFIIKLFETFGILLPAYRGISNDWAKLVSYWYRKYGEISHNKTEMVSPLTEAKEIIKDLERF
jgi:hypothetical protein